MTPIIAEEYQRGQLTKNIEPDIIDGILGNYEENKYDRIHNPFTCICNQCQM